MKLLPRSLGGQLAALMLGGFLVGSLFGTIGLWSRAGALHPIAREHALSRTLTAYRLAQQQPADDSRWLDTFNTRVAQLWIDRTPSPVSMGERELELAAALRERLSASAVAVRMPCRPDALRPALQVAGNELECLEIDLALGDGRWLHTRQTLPVQSLWRESWQLLRFSLLMGIPPVLILMYLFVNRILRPTTALTEAAERMSRGERLEPLQVQGPDEIREIAVAFNEMHERITRFVDERTRMLAAISHDLRTPLTSLVLQAAMLPESDERTEMLRTLEEVRLMVDETLRFATANARAESSAPTDLAAMLRALCERHTALGQQVSLQAPATLIYRCRPMAMRRGLGNLIENAVTYGGSTRVTLRDAGDAGVVVEIQDGGPGIPDEMMERVFEPFFQLDAARNRDASSSVGLGLAIARDCIQAHGGSITLRNVEGSGLLVRVALPSA